jgi:septum site-determining protein MinD
VSSTPRTTPSKRVESEPKHPEQFGVHTHESTELDTEPTSVGKRDEQPVSTPDDDVIHVTRSSISGTYLYMLACVIGNNSIMATVYAVASSKGGVGKTTTTVNLGATLASAGLSVAVVDGDIGMANLGDALGVEPDGATLHDVLAEDSEIPVEDAVYEGPDGLSVLPGDTSIDGFRAAEPTNLDGVLDALDDYDYVLVDTGAGLSHDTVLPLGLADEVVLVSTTERDSLTDTEKTRQVVDRLGGTTRGVVLTRVDPDDPNAEEVAERLAADVIEAIPVDPIVRESMRLSDPLPSYAPGSPAASAYRALASSLTGESIPTPEVVEESDETTDADDVADAADDTDEAAGAADDTDPEPADTSEDVETSAVEIGADDGDVDDASDAEDDGEITLGSPAEEEATDEVRLTEPEGSESEETDTGATESEGIDLDATDEESTSEDVLSADDAEPDNTEAEAVGDETEAGAEAAAETTEDADERADTENADEADDAGDDTEEAGEPSGLTDDDALAADTSPSDDPLVADSAEPDDTETSDDEDTVFTTSLVEEAEPTDEEGDSGTSTDTDEDTEFVEADEEDGDSDDDDGKKGFLGRLLG